jgi:lysozyme
MKLSKAGRKLLVAREGVRLKAYKDSVGVWTIGIGHTSAAGPPAVTSRLAITAAECDEVFARDIVKYEQAVEKALKVEVTQQEFDALVSLCYNIGPVGFARSSVVKRLNVGNREGAAEAFMMWNKPKEIIGRRSAEMRQFIAGAPKKGDTP